MAARAGFDIGSILQHAFHLFKGRLQPASTGPCDGLVLKLHYRWAFFIMLGGFFTVWYGWYFGKVIHCVQSFSGDREARADYQNICLSYPYILEDGKKRFLLFYRWIQWSLLLLAIVYYLPKKVVKALENPKAKKLLDDLASLSPRYDQSENEMVQRAALYMAFNMKTHNEMYVKYVGANVFALAIDISVLHFLDFLFHNRFLMLVPKAYPFLRDPENFTDYISQTFPPFAFCYLNDAHKILDGREEPIGCHLTYMEMYEKVFIILWFLLYSLVAITSLHIAYLLCLLIPSARKHFLQVSKPMQSSTSVNAILDKLFQVTKVGDVYFLMRMKHHLSHARFYELILRISELKMGNPQPQTIPQPQTNPQPMSQGYYLMNQGAQQPIDNQKMPQTFIGNPQMTQQQHYLNQQMAQPPMGNLQMNQQPIGNHYNGGNPPYNTNVVTKRNTNLKNNPENRNGNPKLYPSMIQEKSFKGSSILIE